MTKKPRNFREYQVWQDAVAFSTLVYKQTSEMPWFEKKGIYDQIQPLSYLSPQISPKVLQDHLMRNSPISWI